MRQHFCYSRGSGCNVPTVDAVHDCCVKIYLKVAYVLCDEERHINEYDLTLFMKEAGCRSFMRISS